MSSNKIHCPLCHGTGKIYDSTYGSVTCLNCEGKGIVDNNYEQQNIIDNIKRQNENAERNRRQIEKEESLKRQEREKQEAIQREYNNQQRIRQETKEKRNDNIWTTVLIVFVIAVVITVIAAIYINWDSIVDFFKTVGIIIVCLIVFFGVVIGAGK